MTAPIITIDGWSNDGWITITINGRTYTYFADLAVIQRFLTEFTASYKKGKWFNYLKRAADSYMKGRFGQ